MASTTRKVRFVCVSDTHNASPADGAFKLPAGDVLVHAGDLTKQGSYAELKKTLDWIYESEYKVKLVVAGNHDITLDPDFYAEYGQHFHNQHPQDPQACIDLVKSYQGMTYLNHEYVEQDMKIGDGSLVRLRIFGSPFSPKAGLWAFGYDRERTLWGDSDGAPGLWNHIPLSTDILITHTPPKYHCDESRDESFGCEGLRQALWRVRPLLAICGHVHDARGAQRLTWDLSSTNVRYKEGIARTWEDPGAGNKKQSLLDLSTKSGQPITNTGPWEADCGSQSEVNTQVGKQATVNHASHWAGKGLGGDPSSARSDVEALQGRLGRQETCIVNCAIMATSWPYKPASQGGRRYNKPIVADLDLPILPMRI